MVISWCYKLKSSLLGTGARYFNCYSLVHFYGSNAAKIKGSRGFVDSNGSTFWANTRRFGDLRCFCWGVTGRDNWNRWSNCCCYGLDFASSNAAQ